MSEDLRYPDPKDYWPSPAEVAGQFDGVEKSGDDYWYPRDFDKYVKSDHFIEQVEERQIPDEMITAAVEEGEFYPTNEDGVMGFTQSLGGIGVVVICSGKTAEYPTSTVAITSWAFVDDVDEVKESGVWDEGWVSWVAKQNLEYIEKVGGEIAAPPELEEKMELKERLA